MQASSMSPMNGLYQTIFQLKLSYWNEALSPRTPEQLMCRADHNRTVPRVTDIWPFLDHLPTKTIKWKLSTRRPRQLTCRAETAPVSPTNALPKVIFQVKLSPPRLCSTHSFHELHLPLCTYTRVLHTHYAAHSKSNFGRKQFWVILVYPKF